jgi:hypothetical protein
MNIYIHGENNKDAKSIDVPENSTNEEILLVYKEKFGNLIMQEEILVFVEDEQEHHEHHRHHHNTHIHCHRCKHITVSISYNTGIKAFHVAPSATGKKLLEKAANAFSILPIDAADLLLRLSDGKDIESTDHIGSFVSYPNCAIAISLVPNPQVKGVK